MGTNVPLWALVLSIFVTALATNGLQIWIQGRRDDAAEERHDKAAAEVAAKVEKVRLGLEENGTKVGTRLDEIHTLVNSEASAARAQIAEFRVYIANLERLLMQKMTNESQAPAATSPTGTLEGTVTGTVTGVVANKQ